MARKSIAAWDVKPGMVTTLGTIATYRRRGDLVRVTFVDGGFRNCAFNGRFYLA